MATAKIKKPAKKVAEKKMVVKPTVANSSVTTKVFEWNCIKPNGWYRLVSTDIMSSKSDVVLASGVWERVDGFDGRHVREYEVWRNEKLSGVSAKDYLKKHAEELKKIEEQKKKEIEQKEKETKIITKVSNGDVEFSPTMEKLIRDFGCHETKVRNLMTRLFVEFQTTKRR